VVIQRFLITLDQIVCFTRGGELQEWLIEGIAAVGCNGRRIGDAIHLENRAFGGGFAA